MNPAVQDDEISCVTSTKDCAIQESSITSPDEQIEEVDVVQEFSVRWLNRSMSEDNICLLKVPSNDDDSDEPEEEATAAADDGEEATLFGITMSEFHLPSDCVIATSKKHFQQP